MNSARSGSLAHNIEEPLFVLHSTFIKLCSQVSVVTKLKAAIVMLRYTRPRLKELSQSDVWKFFDKIKCACSQSSVALNLNIAER